MMSRALGPCLSQVIEMSSWVRELLALELADLTGSDHVCVCCSAFDVVVRTTAVAPPALVSCMEISLGRDSYSLQYLGYLYMMEFLPVPTRAWQFDAREGFILPPYP